MYFPVLVAGSLLLAAAGLLATYRGWPWAGIAGALVILGIHGGRYFNVVPDDPYITFRYSQHLAAGDGPVWNAGERVEGYTNFLWMVILAAPAYYGRSLIVTSQVLSFLSTAGIFVVLYLLARIWSAPLDRRARDMIAVISTLALALGAPIAYWTFGGLETCFFAFLVTLGAYLHLREEQAPSRWYWSALVFLLAALTRPEGILFFGLTAAFKIGHLVGRPRGERGLIAFGLWVLAFAAPFAVYFAWRWTYYGYPLPNTTYDKVTLGWEQQQVGLKYVVAFVQQYGGFLLLLTPLSLFLTNDRRQPAYLLTTVALWGAYVVFVGGDFLRAFRMIVPVMPLMYFLLATVVVQLFELVRAARPQQRLLAPLAFVLLLAAGAATMFPSQESAEANRIYDRGAMADRYVAGQWLHEHVPGDYTIAVFYAGAIPYYSQLPAIDMFGLTDKRIAHGHIEGGLVGHQNWDAAYVLSRRPQIIYPHILLQDRLWTQTDYVQNADAFGVGGFRDMLRTPGFWSDYVAAGVKLRDGGWFNFVLRRDSPIEGLQGAGATPTQTRPATLSPTQTRAATRSPTRTTTPSQTRTATPARPTPSP
jgi:arabinofuranosyltransferase